MVIISPNFSLAELTFSQEALRRGIDNTPPPDAVNNLTRLCTTLLEPIRTLLTCALHVDSGYRSVLINADVGGAADSAHLTGCAADVIPIGMYLRAAFDAIKISGLPFDQLILECNAWLHCSVVRDPSMTPRRQPLLASGGPGKWTYSLA